MILDLPALCILQAADIRQTTGPAGESESWVRYMCKQERPKALHTIPDSSALWNALSTYTTRQHAAQIARRHLEHVVLLAVPPDYTNLPPRREIGCNPRKTGAAILRLVPCVS